MRTSKESIIEIVSLILIAFLPMTLTTISFITLLPLVVRWTDYSLAIITLAGLSFSLSLLLLLFGIDALKEVR